METIRPFTESRLADLAKLPEGWTWVKLGESIEILTDGSHFSPKSIDEGYPYITVKDIKNDNIDFNNCSRISDEDYINLVKNGCKPHKGDLLFSKDGTVGKVAIVDFEREFVILSSLAIIRPFETVNDSNFLFWVLKSNHFLKQALKSKKGVAIRRIILRDLKELFVPLPPLPEQRTIVSRIEQLFSDLDNGIANLRLAQEQLKVYRQAVLKKAFEGELTRKWREQQTDLPDARDLLEQIRKEREEAAKASGKKVKPVKPLTEDEIEELPGLPEGWGWVKIGEVSKVGTGVTPLKKRIDFYKDGTIPWVTSGALNEAYVKSASDYVTDIALKETNLKIYPKHTLLVALYGEGKTRGKCSELLIEATTNQAIAAIVQEGTEEEIRSYLKLFLMKNYDEIRMKSSGGVQPNLNLGIIENTSFPLCYLPEQHAIVEEIETRLSVCEKMAQDIDEALEKAEALRQSILKKAFEGKLLSERDLAEVRSAEDWEPAEVLLERIRAERAGNGKR